MLTGSKFEKQIFVITLPEYHTWRAVIRRGRTFLAIPIALLALGACTPETPFHDKTTYFLFEDSARAMDATEAWTQFQEGKFQKQDGHSFNPGFTTSHFWLVLQKDTTTDDRWVEIGTSQINRIAFFSIHNNLPVRKYLTGDNLPFSARPMPSPEFSFPLSGPSPYALLMIDKSNESLQLTFETKPGHLFFDEIMENTVVIGVMSGMIALMLVFGFYLSVITGEKVYLFYILYVAFGWLYVLSNAGIGYKYLWPDSPWFADRARPFFALITVASSLPFITYYAGRAARQWLQLSMVVLASIALVGAMLALTPGVNIKTSTAGYYFQALIPFIVGLYIIMLIAVMLQKIRRRNRMALFYLFSISPIVVFSVLQVFYYSGGADFSGSYIEHYGQATGYVLEAVILTFGLAYRFNNYRRERESLLISLNHQQTRYARAIITTQEAERRQLADQLHDIAGSMLSAARLNLSSMREKNFVANPEGQAKLASAEHAVSSISHMLRNLSHAISPIMLEKVGFRQSVENIVSIFNTAQKIRVELDVTGFESEQPEMTQTFSVLYGILYELVNNVIKHANASHVLIQLVEHEDSIVMIVEDNGQGLKVNGTPTHGLEGIRSKIHYLDGSIEFDHLENRGLIVAIEIPKKNDEKDYSG